MTGGKAGIGWRAGRRSGVPLAEISDFNQRVAANSIASGRKFAMAMAKSRMDSMAKLGAVDRMAT
jgi:hypothetical protein